MAGVKLDGIKKVYDGQVVAVHDATFDIQDGEFIVLVGPSGCGKSTTLRMIAGLESITEGSLFIDDRRVNDVEPKDRDIAMVFQNYALYPHMSVRENMSFGLRLRKFSKADITTRVEQAAEVLGISAILDRKPKQLSGGQRQRVAVGRAIVRNPKVFLFDEPLSNLDAKLRVQMRTEISKLHQRLGATMVYVTHDQVEAMTMGDRIVVMKDGHIQQIDQPLNLYNKPANRFVAGFIGSPAMNFMEGRIVREQGLRFEETGGDCKIAVDDSHTSGLEDYIDRPVTLGVRPEAIHVNGSNGNPTFETRLDVLEPMGNEIIVYANTKANRLVARVQPQSLPEPGQTVSLQANASMFHYFDSESGNVIN